MYVGSDGNHLFAMDACAGTKKWSHDFGDDVVSAPILNKQETVLYVGVDDNSVYAIPTATYDALLPLVLWANRRQYLRGFPRHFAFLWDGLCTWVFAPQACPSIHIP